MRTSQITYPQQDRWSYLWLVIGTLLSFLWRIPLVYRLAPVFYMRFTCAQKTWRGFFLVWLAIFLTVIPPLNEILGAMMPSPLPVFLVTVAITALIMGGIPYLVDRLLAPRLKGFSATLVFPLIMTVMVYISVKSNPLGSIRGAAYFQYNNLALIQLLSITGMWGIVFLVNWLGSVVNYAWERGFAWKEIRCNTLAYVAIMLVVFLYGSARLALSAMIQITRRSSPVRVETGPISCSHAAWSTRLLTRSTRTWRFIALSKTASRSCARRTMAFRLQLIHTDGYQLPWITSTITSACLSPRFPS